jgi:hypothetical protein
MQKRWHVPKLLALLSCERVIISSPVEGGDNSATVVAILDGFTVTERIPANASAPYKWTVFSLCRREAGDEGKSLEKVLQLVTPSKKVAFHAVTPFSFRTRNQRNNIRVSGFPIGEAGEHEIQVWLREPGNPEEKIGYAVYEFPVTHQFLPVVTKRLSK